MIPGIRSTLAGLILGVGGKAVHLDVATVAAAGSTQSGAAPLTAPVNIVTGASGTNGVRLPKPARPGQIVWVYSSAATNALKVYPHAGGDINDGTTNASIDVTARTLRAFIAVDSTTWAA